MSFNLIDSSEMSSDLIKLCEQLLFSSDKAAKLAKLIRFSELFENFTEEKSNVDKKDYKTVGDVLIQEMVRRDISLTGTFNPSQLYGEEDPTFTNSSGQTFNLTLRENQNEMMTIIRNALGCETQLAIEIRDIIYRPYSCLLEETHLAEVINSLKDEVERQILIDPERIGIWIDPIDGTNEYVKGNSQMESIIKFKKELDDKKAVIEFPGSLQIAQILIGVFDINTKESIFGIVNAPFMHHDSCEIYAALTLSNICWTYIPIIESYVVPYNICQDLAEKDCNEKTSIFFGRKDKIRLNKLEDYLLVVAPGAGFKLLALFTRQIDLFVKLDNSIYLYDVCGPSCIVKSLGGGMASALNTIATVKMLLKKPGEWDFRNEVGRIIRNNEIEFYPKLPDHSAQDYSLKNGIIAYLELEKAVDFVIAYCNL